MYSDLASLDGFRRSERQSELYKAVVNWYEEVKAQTPTGKGKKTTEQDVIDVVNKESNREMWLVDDEFSRYDAEDKHYIAEIKIRYRWYPDCIIEHDKYEANMALADEKDKDFIYIVYVEQDTCYDIYVFNCTRLTLNDYKFRWDWKELPKSTELGEVRNLVVKFVGFIDIDRASVHYGGVRDA